MLRSGLRIGAALVALLAIGCGSIASNKEQDCSRMSTYPIAGGCGDVLAFAATADWLEWVVVQLDRSKFDLTDDRAVHDLSTADPSIQVSIDRYSVAPEEPYCTDVEPPPGSEHRVMHWKATRGRLKIVALDPLPELHSGKTYRVRVRLEEVEFKDVNGAVMSRVAIEFESTVGGASG
jgi:hypothetical protein